VRSETLEYDRPVADVAAAAVGAGLLAAGVWPVLDLDVGGPEPRSVLTVRIRTLWCSEPGDEDGSCRSAMDLELTTDGERRWAGVVEILTEDEEELESAFRALLERTADQVLRIAAAHGLAGHCGAPTRRGTTFSVVRGADRDLVTLPGAAPGDRWVALEDAGRRTYYRVDGVVSERMHLVGAGEHRLLPPIGEGRIVARGTVPGPDGAALQRPARWIRLVDGDGAELTARQLRHDPFGGADQDLYDGRLEATVDGAPISIPDLLTVVPTERLRAALAAQRAVAAHHDRKARQAGAGAAVLGAFGGALVATGTILPATPGGERHEAGGRGLQGWGASMLVGSGIVGSTMLARLAARDSVHARLRGTDLRRLRDGDAVWRAVDAANREGR